MPNHVCDMSHVRWPRHTAVWHRWHSAAWHMWYSVAWHMWHSGVCDVFIFVSQISCAWVMSNMHVCDMPHVRWPRHQRRVTHGAFIHMRVTRHLYVCCASFICVSQVSYIYIYIYIHIFIYIYLYVNMDVNMCVYIHTYWYIYIYIYIRM